MNIFKAICLLLIALAISYLFETSFGMSKLSELGELGFGMLVLCKLGELSFGIFKLG